MLKWDEIAFQDADALRVSKMRFYCSSMLKFFRFSVFDVGVFLSFEVLKMLKNSI